MKLRIFIASPGDVVQERDIVSVVVEEIRRTIGDIRNVELETIRWETHAWPDIGEDAQDVINEQIGEFDVFVGIMWKRFGSLTKRSGSGTGEEFERAYNFFTRYGRPKIMFYFRNAPFYTTDGKEWAQFKKVISFRMKLEKLGVLFWEYNQPIDFERDVREHLIRQILELTEMPKKEETKETPLVFLSSSRDDLHRVAPVYNALAAAGFRPWLDVENLLPGQKWEFSIQKAIKEAHFFVVFISHNSISKKGYVQKEVRIALDLISSREIEEHYIIPVRLDPIEPPKSLIQYQWIDLFSPKGLEKLIFALRFAWEMRIERRKRP